MPEPIPGGRFPADIKALHGELSPAGAAFLELAEREPEVFARRKFNGGEASPLLPYELHAWPTFIAPERAAQVREMATGLCRLIKRAPRRLLKDPAKAAAYYGIAPDRAETAFQALALTDDARGAISRGDFIDGTRGLKCLEFNLTAGVGGWETAIQVQQVMGQPVVRRFAQEQRLRVRPPQTVHAFFSNIVDCVRRDTEWEGECNVAILFPPRSLPAPQVVALGSQLFTAQLQEILKPLGARGEVMMTTYDAIGEAEGHRLTAHGKRVHAVVEYESRDRVQMAGPEFIERAWNALTSRTISLFNGPAQDVLDDKRNLVLLSEHESSPLLSPEEQKLVRQHLPWTRRLERTHVERDGERFFLPDLLASRREELVIKAGRDFGGFAVLVGAATPPAEWDAAVRKGLDAGSWVVQEEVRPRPYHYLGPEETVIPHIVIWGLFVSGDLYAGHFLRLCPMGRGTGVVNAMQGAMFGALVELE
jgi:hypothetical protein